MSMEKIIKLEISILTSVVEKNNNNKNFFLVHQFEGGVFEPMTFWVCQLPLSYARKKIQKLTTLKKDTSVLKRSKTMLKLVVTFLKFFVLILT